MTPAEAPAAVRAYLETHPWLRDPGASKRGLRFALIWMCGLDPVEPHDYYESGDAGRVVEMAEAGDQIAYDAIVEVATHLTDRAIPLPNSVQKYLLDIARRKQPQAFRRGRHPITNLHRDDAIFHAVEIARKAGFSATQNEDHEDDHQSACSIVADVLESLRVDIAERSVEKIWARRRAARQRGGFIC
ncbi:hypothetical protein ACFSOZ_06810 [Mesorhizobium newzealandense]|uniref:Uncharacterized protein n=1 Tax=Mesorhizobium newzealandense TaxID=1300302 RepID=A0ABW4U8J8_9HYPH